MLGVPVMELKESPTTAGRGSDGHSRGIGRSANQDAARLTPRSPEGGVPAHGGQNGI